MKIKILKEADANLEVGKVYENLHPNVAAYLVTQGIAEDVGAQKEEKHTRQTKEKKNHDI
jgi:hypothetical protein